MSDDADTEAEEPVMDDTHPTDEEQTEREWYFWLGALLLVGVILLVVLPSLRFEIGVGLVLIAAVVWLYKTGIEATE